MIMIVTHTRFDLSKLPVHGTGSEIIPFLHTRNKDYLYLQHSIFNGIATLVTKQTGKNQTKKFIGFEKLVFPIRIMQEFIITFSSAFRIPGNIQLFIGIDPVNAFAGIILKKLGKAKFVIFYTADYAPNRFANKILNNLYHALDRYAIKHVDQVWNVSTRIVNIREHQGVPKEKNFFVPNSPSIKNISPLSSSKIKRFDLIIVSHLAKSIDFLLMIHATKILSKRFPKLRLIIIGNGESKKELEREVVNNKLSNRILFMGHLTHNQVLERLLTSGVGLAIYTNDEPWTYYGDSMKVREYLACGLPVIVTDIPSTADDIRKEKAGLVIPHNLANFQEAIVKLLSNKNLYEKMRFNAIELSKKYDFHMLMQNTIPKEIL